MWYLALSVKHVKPTIVLDFGIFPLLLAPQFIVSSLMKRVVPLWNVTNENNCITLL